MQKNLKNSLRFIHNRSMQKVICYNVNKEKGISPDVDKHLYSFPTTNLNGIKWLLDIYYVGDDLKSS